MLNNLLFATNLKNAAELLRLAEHLNFNAKDVANIIQKCSGGSYAMRSFLGDATVAAALERSRKYVEKDVATAASSATEAGVDMHAFTETVEYFIGNTNC